MTGFQNKPRNENASLQLVTSLYNNDDSLEINSNNRYVYSTLYNLQSFFVLGVNAERFFEKNNSIVDKPNAYIWSGGRQSNNLWYELIPTWYNEKSGVEDQDEMMQVSSF